MTEFDITEQIIRYLDGEMDPPERASWDARISADPALQQQLRELQMAMEAVQLAGTSDMVGRIHQEMTAASAGPLTQTATVRALGKGTWMRVAAAITVLLLLTAGWWVSQTTNKAIYADHMVDFAVSNARGQGSQDDITAAFDRKDFAKVVGLSAGAAVAKDSLLTGIALMHLGKYDDAAHWLLPLRQSGTVRDDADYYYAFTMLGKGHRKEALVIFQSIRHNPEHIYHAVVTPSLLRKLRFTVW